MPQMLEKVGKNFKIIRKIDEGAFGEIYQAINTKTNLEVAVKVEPINSDHPQLIYECKLYNYLHNDSTVIDKGIPNVYYCSTEGDYNVLVMDLMGPSLESLFNQTLRKFSLKTVLMLIDQMIQRIEYIHNRNFIHRDIKPDNFCVGFNKTSHKIFILDFGLAKRYIQRDGKHIPYREGKNLTGTARYASINTHLGIEQACRDDMESIGYVCMYFLRGMLPWQGLKANNKRDKYERIKEKKLTTSIEVLTKGYPVEFTKYLSQTRNLRFDERPNYKAMRAMFKELSEKNGYKLDYQYDWVIFAEKKGKVEKKDDKKEEA
jgi:casein kinase 1